jgi:hypothetical protein
MRHRLHLHDVAGTCVSPGAATVSGINVHHVRAASEAARAQSRRAESAAIKRQRRSSTDAAADVNAPRCVQYPAACTVYSRGVAKRGKGGVAQVALLRGHRRLGPMRRALATQRQRRQAPHPLCGGGQRLSEPRGRERWKALAAERALAPCCRARRPARAAARRAAPARRAALPRARGSSAATAPSTAQRSPQAARNSQPPMTHAPTAWRATLQRANARAPGAAARVCKVRYSIARTGASQTSMASTAATRHAAGWLATTRRQHARQRSDGQHVFNTHSQK